MKNLIFALALLAVPLAGCAEITAFRQTIGAVSVTQRDAALAMEAFDAAEIAATSYMRLARCNGRNGPICRSPSARPMIDGAIYAGRAARNNIKAFIRSHPDQNIALADYNTLTAATKAISDATAAYRAASAQ